MIECIDTSKNKVRNFGFLFGGVFAALSLYAAWKGGPLWPLFLALAAAFIFCGLFARPLLRPVYIAWMVFAFALGWVNTRLLLGLFFYLIMTPVALILRLAGKDLLDRRPDRAVKSYWIPRERTPLDRSRYERLF